MPVFGFIYATSTFIMRVVLYKPCMFSPSQDNYLEGWENTFHGPDLSCMTSSPDSEDERGVFFGVFLTFSVMTYFYFYMVRSRKIGSTFPKIFTLFGPVAPPQGLNNWLLAPIQQQNSAIFSLAVISRLIDDSMGLAGLNRRFHGIGWPPGLKMLMSSKSPVWLCHLEWRDMILEPTLWIFQSIS